MYTTTEDLRKVFVWRVELFFDTPLVVQISGVLVGNRVMQLK